MFDSLPVTIDSIQLASPAGLFFLVLALVPWFATRARPRVRWPSLTFFPSPTGLNWRSYLPTLLKSLAIVALAIAIGRPQTVAGEVRLTSKGLAIVLVLDRSRTMTTIDSLGPENAPTRLELAKETIREFIEGRPNDQIGLVTFASLPDLNCPPTFSHDLLIGFVDSVAPAPSTEAATDIGDAIIEGLSAAEASEALEKVIVLITDGKNQPDRSLIANPVEPEEAADLVRTLGARLYTIGVGPPDLGLDTNQDDPGTPGYEAGALRDWAGRGGGVMFQAADTNGLRAAFQELDRLEQSRVTETIQTRYREEYQTWVVVALVLLMIDRLLGLGRLRRLP